MNVQLIKVKAAFLIGPALDWAVAKCNGTEWWAAEEPRDGLYLDYERTARYSPSTNWAQGGPIIEREKISLVTKYDDANVWIGSVLEPEWKVHRTGPNPLVAAMRCYVANKIGEEIEVPEILLAWEA